MMSKSRSDLFTRFAIWATIAVVTCLILLTSVNYAYQIYIFAALLAIQTISLNLLIGFTGLFSVAHIGFVALGAYTVAILTRTSGPTDGSGGEIAHIGLGFFTALPCAFLICTLFGLVLMYAFRKLKDDYFSLATLGFAFIAQQVLFNARYFTRGALGMGNIPRPQIGEFVIEDQVTVGIALWIAVAAVAALAIVLTRSSYGRILMGIREDEEALAVFGYNTTVYKVSIFALASGLAGLSGGIAASYIGFVAPNDFTLLESLILSALVTAGGMASIEGAIAAAILWALAQEVLRFIPGLGPEEAGQVRMLLLGGALVVLMFIKPQGLLGRFKL